LTHVSVVDTAEYIKDKAEDVGDFAKEGVIDAIKEKLIRKNNVTLHLACSRVQL
jgi:hypothetical protein